MTAAIHPSAQLAAARVGAGVRVGPLAAVGAGAVLEDGCTLGASACVGEGAVIGTGAAVGEGAVVAARVRVGEGARIEAGAVVMRQVPARAVVRGPEATVVGYADASAHLPARVAPAAPGVLESAVRGVRLHVLREVRDMRGDLCAAEVGAGLPFLVRRSFLVYNVPNAELRGEHAHRRCAQFLMAVKGSVRVVADDGAQREEFSLDRPNLGLHLPPMTWGIQYRYSEGAVLLVLASDPYDPADYIRDYAEFVALVRRGPAA
ncbi:MAG: WxcM-like domain-containing protein [Ottowia sp.]|uniref:WxcM-like domain-containing protein n=1 Tax=Ottowia sp. TaxID=1898956 RepID=UPI0039E5DE71